LPISSQSYANFTPLPDQYYGAGCSAVGAVRLASLRSDSGVLQISNLGPVTCPLANTLSGWARFGVDRAARTILGEPAGADRDDGQLFVPQRGGHQPPFRACQRQCRRCQRIRAGRRTPDHRAARLGQRDPQIRAFLERIRDSACKRFGTVLSPQYNAAHRDHFHLEVGGGQPFCH
jgi:hypothetical protein